MTTSPTPRETVVARLTPPGTAAIASLGVYGPRAWDVIRGLFRPRGKNPLPSAPDPGRLWLGRLGDTGDEVVLSARRGATDSTEGAWLELHTHGGEQVLGLTLDTLEAAGLRRCDWTDLERLTGSSPLRAQAAAALAAAPTVRTAGILLDQFHGAFERAIETILADIENQKNDAVTRGLADLRRSDRLGAHLTDPWTVAVAGPPNVGKSSLVNALAGYSRCIVAPTPGTTRDVVTLRLAFDGWPVEIADTAGRRAAADPIEAAGIDRGRREATTADLCLWVMGATEDYAEPPADIRGPIIVINKTDLVPVWSISEVYGAVCVSALTGEGVADLCAEIARRLVPVPPVSGAAVAFTPELDRWVGEAAGAWERGDHATAADALRRCR